MRFNPQNVIILLFTVTALDFPESLIISEELLEVKIERYVKTNVPRPI